MGGPGLWGGWGCEEAGAVGELHRSKFCKLTPHCSALCLWQWGGFFFAKGGGRMVSREWGIDMALR